MANNSLDFRLNLTANTDNFNGNVDAARSAVNTLVSALSALGLGLSVRELAATADEFKTLEARIRIAVGATGDFKGAMSGISQIAIETRSNLSDTGNLFATINRSAKELNITQEQALALTRTINQATIVGGGSASSNAAAIQQLNQALQSGVLRGEEYNSVLEQSPRIAKALADGLGVTMGEMRKMAETGQLTSQIVVKALQSQADVINGEFAKMPMTIGGAIENLKTSWTLYIGEADKANGISASVAKAIGFVADNLETLVGVLKMAAEAAAIYKLADIAATLNAKASAARVAQQAIVTETAAIVANTQANLANASAARTTAAAHSGIGGAIASTLPTFARAATGALNLVTQLGAYGAAAAGIAVAGKIIYDTLDSVGTKIGETTAKWVLHAQGLKTADEIEKEIAQKETEAIKRKEAYAKALQTQSDAINTLKYASQGLVGESKNLVVEFDKQVAAGKSAKEAIDSLAKSLQFDSTKSIDTSITALVALQQQGKITEEQVKAIFSNVLKGQDLIVFQTNAVAAFSAIEGKITELTQKNELQKQKVIELREQLREVSQELRDQQELYDGLKDKGTPAADAIAQKIDVLHQKTFELQERQKGYNSSIKASEEQIKALSKVHNTEVEKMALLQEQLLNAAIARTGLSLEQLQGKSSKAFGQAANDIQYTIDHMDELKSKGIDTGLMLGKSFENAINTASSQAELDNLSRKIEANRQLLGDKITDGLLQQVEAQAIKAKAAIEGMTPGLQSVAEAAAQLGIKTKDELNLAADTAKSAYESIRNSSEVTAAGQRKALQAVIDAAYESGDASRIAYAQGEAAAQGFTVAVDKSGKAVLNSLFDVESGTDRVGRGFDRAGNSGVRAAQSVQEAWDNTVTSISKAAAKLDEITRKQGGMTGSDFLNGGNGNLNKSLNDAGLLSYSEDQIKQKLISEKGYDTERASREAKKIFNDQSWARGGVTISNGQLGMSQSGALTNYDYVNSVLDKLDSTISSTLSTMSNNQPEKMVNINMTLDGKTVSARVPASQEQNFLDMLKQAKRVS